MAMDKAALRGIKLEKNAASYKLKYGLAAALDDTLLQELKTSPFSLNIDEATSKTQKRVLAVLVSHFSESLRKIVVHHLAAFSLTKVTAENIFAELDKLFTDQNLPWENLVSILMDSCAVMRGTKGGVETLIRQRKAPHLLDIDGDSCHHAHNAAKQFCKPFGNHVETLLSDIYTDFKWSVDQKEKLWDICHVLGLSPTTPERYVPHRWLSVLDVGLDTVRLMDAYTLFFFSYLTEKDQSLYSEIVEDIFTRNSVSPTSQTVIRKLQKELRGKWTSFTKEGKDRKTRIVEKLFIHRTRTYLVLYFYTSVLPDLKEYVLFFQCKEASMHLLHSKQQELFKNFCSNFLTPDCLQGSLHKLDISADEHQLSTADLFLGTRCTTLLDSREGVSQKKQFLKEARQAYHDCAKCLQRKMPLNSDTLKMCAAFDPEVRGSETCLKYLKKVPKLTQFVCDPDSYDREIRKYNVDSTIENISSDQPVDLFWSKINPQKYPSLTKAAKALLSGFHGPMVESSFSIMGDLMDEKSGHLDIGTYAAFQTVKYHLKAEGKTSVEKFAKAEPVKDAVDGTLSKLMQGAWRKRVEHLEQRRNDISERKKALGAPHHKAPTKKSDKEQLLAEAGKDKWHHHAGSAISTQITEAQVHTSKHKQSHTGPTEDAPSAKKGQTEAQVHTSKHKDKQSHTGPTEDAPSAKQGQTEAQVHTSKHKHKQSHTGPTEDGPSAKKGRFQEPEETADIAVIECPVRVVKQSTLARFWKK